MGNWRIVLSSETKKQVFFCFPKWKLNQYLAKPRGFGFVSFTNKIPVKLVLKEKHVLLGKEVTIHKTTGPHNFQNIHRKWNDELIFAFLQNFPKPNTLGKLPF